MDRLLKMPWWLQVVLLAVAAILYIEAAGLLGTKLIPPLVGWGQGIVAEVAADSVPGRFARWDSNWYLIIAQDGYKPDGRERAFFPLYPVLTGIVSRALGVSVLWSGLIISFAAFIGAGLLLYRWLLIDYEHDLALRATGWMYFFPMSFFFLAFYAEGLFLLVSVASVYFARRGRFVSSGIAVALAGATRGTAIMLGIPYVIEFLRQRVFTRGQCLRFAIGSLVAPLGFLAFVIFRGAVGPTGSGEWLTRFTWPWNLLVDGLNAAVFGIGITANWFSRALVWHDLLYAISGLVVGIWALKRVRLGPAAYSLAGMALVWTLHGPYGYAFWSTPRRVAVLFPLYLALGLAEDRWPLWFRRVSRVLSLVLLGALAAWFASGRWVS